MQKFYSKIVTSFTVFALLVMPIFAVAEITITPLWQQYNASDVSQSIDATGYSALIVGYVKYNNGQPATVTYDSVALTSALFINQAIPTQSTGGQGFYYIVNPSSGSNTLVVDYGNATSNFTNVFGLTGINTDDFVEDSGTQTAASGNPTISLTQADEIDTGAILMGCNRVNTTNSHVPGSGYSGYTDAQGCYGDNNNSRHSAYGVYTDGSGAKTVDNGTNNYGTVIGHSEIGIIFNAGEPVVEDSGTNMIMSMTF